ncbi:MAG: apolipoprotein N-acyltransferase, partial [Dolichospermum sp.]
MSLVSGIFMGTTVAPIGAWFLAWVSLAPLWMLLVKITPKTDKTYPSAPILGFILGIGYPGVALSWIK